MPALIVMCILHSWELRGDLQICAMWESDFGKVTFALAAGCFAVLCSNLVVVVRGKQKRGPSCWAGRCGGGGPARLYRSLLLQLYFCIKDLHIRLRISVHACAYPCLLLCTHCIAASFAVTCRSVQCGKQFRQGNIRTSGWVLCGAV